MVRPISTYDFSKLVRQKLLRAGFSDDSCFKGMTPLTLSKAAQLDPADALKVLKIVQAPQGLEDSSAQKITAYDLAKKEQTDRGVITFSEKIDALFGDGIPLGKITEVCGVPGVGKTQFSMQLCVDATIPDCFGGLQGQSIYVDTEGSFVAERVAQMATATVNHCHTIAKSSNDKEMLEGIRTYNTESVLKSIHYFRCNTSLELIALAYQLPVFIEKQCSNVKVIIVDSFAFHFRHDWQDMSNRTRVMSSLAQQFIKLANSLHAAIIFINQMTTKIQGSSAGTSLMNASSKIVPALGESWSHVASNRLLLFWQNEQRFANLFKSSSRKEDTVPYRVTVNGIRDAEEDQEGLPLESPAKKRRLPLPTPDV